MDSSYSDLQKKKGCIAKATATRFDSLKFKMHPPLLVNWLWWGEMTTSFQLEVYHRGVLLRFFADILGQHAVAQKKKCVLEVFMNTSCKIKLDLKLFAMPLSNSKRPSCGPACPPGQSGALFAANVYAENTWTEFELPYDVGLFLAVMSCWQQGVPQTHTVPIPSAKHTICCTSIPNLLNPRFCPPSTFISIYISLSIYLPQTFRATHSRSHTKEDATAITEYLQRWKKDMKENFKK